MMATRGREVEETTLGDEEMGMGMGMGKGLIVIVNVV